MFHIVSAGEPLIGVKNPFEPCLSIKILVPFRVLFVYFLVSDENPSSFYMGASRGELISFSWPSLGTARIHPGLSESLQKRGLRLHVTRSVIYSLSLVQRGGLDRFLRVLVAEKIVFLRLEVRIFDASRFKLCPFTCLSFCRWILIFLLINIKDFSCFIG